MAYTQIICISRSTFTPNPARNGIEPNVAGFNDYRNALGLGLASIIKAV